MSEAVVQTQLGLAPRGGFKDEAPTAGEEPGTSAGDPLTRAVGALSSGPWASWSCSRLINLVFQIICVRHFPSTTPCSAWWWVCPRWARSSH